MSKYDELKTPEERRAWIESLTGLGGKTEALEKMRGLMGPFMNREDVISAVRTVVNEEPVEKEGVLWIGEYRFTFDDHDRLETGPVYESSSGSVRIGEVRRGTYVLGQQMADARKAESLRVAEGPSTQSPMPSLRYDEERGDFNLVSVSPLPIDEKLRTLASDFRQCKPARREKVRRSMSMEELYTLLQFAKRSAVMALNDSSPEPCENGLLALAMIDETRIDQRDAEWTAALLNYAISATTEGHSEILHSAIGISTPGMGKILRRSRGSADLSEWGYAEVRTDSGLGLIESEWFPYAPSLKLGEIALSVADWLNEGRYVARPKIAVEVPDVWFGKDFRAAAQSILGSARGAVSVSGTLRRSYSRDFAAQMLVHWLVELPSRDASAQLVKFLGSGLHISGRFAVGYSVGSLFGLLVAGSAVDGVEPYESLESLTNYVLTLQSLICGIEPQEVGP